MPADPVPEQDGWREIRLYLNHFCVDINSYDGEGHLQTYYQCDGYLD